MKALLAYVLNVLIAVDQCLNALRGGSPDETLSAAAYRVEGDGKILGMVSRPCIDALFYIFEKDHCKKSYDSEVLRRQLPAEYRK